MRKLMIIAAAAASLTILTAASADEGDAIAQEAQECISPILDFDLDEGPIASVKAIVEDGGIVTDVAVETDFEATKDRVISGMVLRAVMRCAPYDVSAGAYQFEINYEDPFE